MIYIHSNKAQYTPGIVGQWNLPSMYLNLSKWSNLRNATRSYERMATIRGGVFGNRWCSYQNEAPYWHMRSWDFEMAYYGARCPPALSV